MVPRSLLNQPEARPRSQSLDALAAAPPPRGESRPSRCCRSLRASLASRTRDEADPARCPSRPVGPVPDGRNRPRRRSAAGVRLDLPRIRRTSRLFRRRRRRGPEVLEVPTPPIFLATPRIQKPGEARSVPVPRRGWGPTASSSATPGGFRAFCASERSIPFVADFSLNAANELADRVADRQGRPSE